MRWTIIIDYEHGVWFSLMGCFVMVDWVINFNLWLLLGLMADQGLEGSQPVDLAKHPSGIVPTLQWVSKY